MICVCIILSGTRMLPRQPCQAQIAQHNPMCALPGRQRLWTVGLWDNVGLGQARCLAGILGFLGLRVGEICQKLGEGGWISGSHSGRRRRDNLVMKDNNGKIQVLVFSYMAGSGLFLPFSGQTQVGRCSKLPQHCVVIFFCHIFDKREVERLVHM